MDDDLAFEYRISPGVEGVRETLVLMRSIVRKSKADPVVIQTARNLTAHLAPKNWQGEIAALFSFVRDRIRYVLDPNDVETLSSPRHLLKNRSGDCDDLVTLLAALLEAIGHPTRFVAVGFQPGALTHVYLETKAGDAWIALETTEQVAMGELPFARNEVKNRYIVTN